MPSHALSGRDPQHGKIGLSRYQGFTVIELMIAIGVLAIAMSLALPSYRTIIEKRQVTSGAEQLAAFLSSVQVQAIKFNQDFAISNLDGDSQCMGYSMGQSWCDCGVDDPASDAFCWTDIDGNGEKAPGEKSALMVNDLKYPTAFDGVTMYSGDAAIDEEPILVFDSVRGMLQDDLANAADRAVIRFVSTEGTYALNVEVTPTGRVGICNPVSDDYTPVPGYKPCRE